MNLNTERPHVPCTDMPAFLPGANFTPVSYSGRFEDFAKLLCQQTDLWSHTQERAYRTWLARRWATTKCSCLKSSSVPLRLVLCVVSGLQDEGSFARVPASSDSCSWWPLRPLEAWLKEESPRALAMVTAATATATVESATGTC